METCANCMYFKLSKGAYYVGDCLADVNRITTINSKAEFCNDYNNKEKEKDGTEEN